jgi:quercetin dioxygenase-like cupin family protein
MTIFFNKGAFLMALMFISLTFNALGQESTHYSIANYNKNAIKAPNTNYEGEAWLNFVLQSDTGFIYNLTHAHFKANSTLDWHYHATPQVLVVVDGVGYYQERGKDPILMKEGDVIRCEKGVEHWHSSSAESDVSYVAIYGSSPTTWTEKLSREAYQAVAETLASQPRD